MSAMERTATISEDQRYRYDLTRTWDPRLPKALWVMLNPSTADSWSEDPTLRRCIGFSKREGMGGLVVVNLMAWRATRPADLPAAVDTAVGPENAAVIERWLSSAALVVAAWGSIPALPRFKSLAAATLQRLASRDVHCLGTTAAGQPKHPLYVKGDQPLVLYRAAWRSESA